MKRSSSDFGELLRTTLPLIAVTLLSSAATFADRFFLGHYAQSALAAVTPAATLTNVFFCFIITIVSYTGTFIAHYYGGGRQRQAVRALGQGFWLCGLSVVALLIALPLGNLLIRTTCPSAELMHAELTYFNITLPAQALVTFSAVLVGYYTAERQTTRIARATIVGCLTNILLDPILIFGTPVFSIFHFPFSIPSLGITGAAVATLVSAATTTVLLLRPFLSRCHHRQRFLRLLAFNRTLSLRILRFALPNALSYLVGTACFYAFIHALSKTGETALAISNVCLCVNGLYYAVIEGTRQTLTAQTGRCCGSGDYRSVNKLLSNSLKIAGYALIPVSLAYCFFGGQITSLFGKPGSDLDTYLKIGSALFGILIVNNFFETLQTLLSATLIGSGDTVFSMKSAAYVQLLFWMPTVAIILTIRPDIVGLWASLVFWRILHVVILGIRWRSRKWQEIRLT